MSDRVPIQRLPTGVPGLDAVLGGGVPELSCNGIAGTPGAGKTTLVQQITFALARADRPALFFTVLGEPPLKPLPTAIRVLRPHDMLGGGIPSGYHPSLLATAP